MNRPMCDSSAPSATSSATLAQSSAFLRVSGKALASGEVAAWSERMRLNSVVDLVFAVLQGWKQRLTRVEPTRRSWSLKMSPSVRDIWPWLQLSGYWRTPNPRSS